MPMEFWTQASYRFAFEAFPQTLIDLGFREASASHIASDELLRHSARVAAARIGMVRAVLELVAL